jgi:hypothetical protein
MKLQPTSLYLASDGNIYNHFRSPNTTIFDMSVKAACAALEVHQNKADKVFDDMLQFFDEEVQLVKQMDIEAQELADDDNNFDGESRFNRVAFPQIIERCTALTPNSSVQKLLEFCITKGSIDESSEVSEQSLRAAEVLIKAKGKDIASKMLEILQKFTDNADSY